MSAFRQWLLNGLKEDIQRVFPDAPISEIESDLWGKPIGDRYVSCFEFTYPKGYVVGDAKVVKTQFFPCRNRYVQVVRHLMEKEDGRQYQEVSYQKVRGKEGVFEHEEKRYQKDGWEDVEEIEEFFAYKSDSSDGEMTDPPEDIPYDSDDSEW